MAEPPCRRVGRFPIAVILHFDAGQQAVVVRVLRIDGHAQQPAKIEAPFNFTDRDIPLYPGTFAHNVRREIIMNIVRHRDGQDIHAGFAGKS